MTLPYFKLETLFISWDIGHSEVPDWTTSSSSFTFSQPSVSSDHPLYPSLPSLNRTPGISTCDAFTDIWVLNKRGYAFCSENSWERRLSMVFLEEQRQFVTAEGSLKRQHVRIRITKGIRPRARLEQHFSRKRLNPQTFATGLEWNVWKMLLFSSTRQQQ